jgi:hypothetical protein
MTEVKSSNIHSIGHSGAALYIRFRANGEPGKIYRYPTCGPEFHEQGLAAPSPGLWFVDRVKHFHKGEPVEG